MQLITAAITGPAGSGPAIGRRAAQRLARRELSRSIYQPDLWQRFLNWLGRLYLHVNSAVPRGWWAAVVVAIAAVLIIGGLLYWVRPAAARRRRPAAPVAGGTPRTASDHRREAERLAADRDFSGAIIELVRAIAVGLEERGVLAPRPGRTAAELAADAGQALPDRRADLRAAAALFDDVRYGELAGTEDGFRTVRDTELRLRSARPVTAGSAAGAFAAAGQGAAPR